MKQQEMNNFIYVIDTLLKNKDLTMNEKKQKLEKLTCLIII